MILENSFKHLRRAGVIPNTFGINDRNRAVDANAQAISFGSINQRLGSDEVQFFKSALEVLPRGEVFVLGSALGL
jgi:hypothetical protein